jgi:putative FmdB family regulatory protein
MPIYEYTCKKCGAHMEVMQKVSDKPLARHAKCGGKLEKEWSRTGFQFKGSGWYVTDYAGKSKDAKEGKESKSDSPDSPESKKVDSSESKTKSGESKTEPKDAKSSESKDAKKSSSAPASGGGD